MTNKDHILQTIIQTVNNTAPDSEVYLYGSQASGTAKNISDWDLLILLNKSNVPFEFETRFINAFYELELETGEVISPLIYSKKDWSSNRSITRLFGNIKKEGVRLK